MRYVIDCIQRRCEGYDLPSPHRDRNALYRERALNAYIDILTLKERIAGRSPAFEGIRLVKERVR